MVFRHVAAAVDERPFGARPESRPGSPGMVLRQVSAAADERTQRPRPDRASLSPPHLCADSRPVSTGNFRFPAMGINRALDPSRHFMQAPVAPQPPPSLLQQHPAPAPAPVHSPHCVPRPTSPNPHHAYHGTLGQTSAGTPSWTERALRSLQGSLRAGVGQEANLVDFFAQGNVGGPGPTMAEEHHS